MIRIDFQEPTEPDWVDWRNKCSQEQAALNASVIEWLNKWSSTPTPHDKKRKSKEKPKAEEKVYKGQKEQIYFSLAGPFRGKCAYCEIRIYSGFHGDVEHFRPKGAVVDRDSGSSVKIALNGLLEDHPGYYWLAYEWTNLLPACQLCNQPSSARSEGRPLGKRNYFPLGNNFRATQPGEERHEEPLLINPLAEDPDDHLELDITGGNGS